MDINLVYFYHKSLINFVMWERRTERWEEIISGWDDLGQRSSLLVVVCQVRCGSSIGGLGFIKIVNNIAGKNIYRRDVELINVLHFTKSNN